MIRIKYCPNCGRELYPTYKNGEEFKLSDNGRLYSCINCNSKYKTDSLGIYQLDEHRYKYILDEAYRHQVDMKDLENKVAMEKAYEEAAKKNNYELPENYIKEDN